MLDRSIGHDSPVGKQLLEATATSPDGVGRQAFRLVTVDRPTSCATRSSVRSTRRWVPEGPFRCESMSSGERTTTGVAGALSAQKTRVNGRSPHDIRLYPATLAQVAKTTTVRAT